MKLDPAVLRALSLSEATVSAHGGSGFASTAKITTLASSSNGSKSERNYFMKTSSTPGAQVMFAGEHASLNAIHAAVPNLCPQSYAHGPLENGGFFLVTDFLDLSSGYGTGGSKIGNGSEMSLAEKLAKLHTTPAGSQFGFPVSTCCGDTVQDNSFSSSWADFFSRRRLLAILDQAERSNGKDTSLRRLVEQTVQHVIPRLIGDEHLNHGKGVTPVVVHGDLWSGNRGRGRMSSSSTSKGAVEDVIFDPSACYAHSEFELGIMQMFGGFSGNFMHDYHKLCPKTEPTSEYEDRVKLYESYHHLNHYAIFGGGYKSGAAAILRKLVDKYGPKSET